MGGKMSRRKGSRVEYLVRDYLRTLGYQECHRVPLSGASQGFKGDVVFTDANGKVHTVEVKARANGFTTIYKKFIDTNISHPNLGTISIFKAVLTDVFLTKGPELQARDIKQFETLNRMRAGADYLAIKDNNKPLVFIKFGDVYGPTDR